MPRRREPVEHAERQCGYVDCSNRFTPQRSTAVYCSKVCGNRAARARKAAERNTAEEKQAGSDAEHALVKAVRKQLEDAAALETVNGQLALELARRAVSPDSNLVSMSKELDARMAAALGTTKPAAAGSEPAVSEVVDDEVNRARESRERKAREAAAGRA